MDIIIFNTATEKILQVCHTNRTDLLPEAVAQKVFIQLNLNAIYYTVREIKAGFTTNKFKKYFYILEGIVTPKEYFVQNVSTSNIVADGEDICTITNIPEGTEIIIGNESVGLIESDGEFNITTNVPKKLIVNLSKFGYIPERIIINAT